MERATELGVRKQGIGRPERGRWVFLGRNGKYAARDEWGLVRGGCEPRQGAVRFRGSVKNARRKFIPGRLPAGGHMIDTAHVRERRWVVIAGENTLQNFCSGSRNFSA